MVSYHTFHHSPTLPRRLEHGFAEVVLQHKGPQSPVEQAAKARTAADLSAYSSGTCVPGACCPTLLVDLFIFVH